ncbi:MAG: DUF1178 family protein [Rhodospirillales bacterium]|jgi:hypothetical protein
MILYQLACHEGHEFEAWFRDSKTYEKQCKSGDIVCPFCGDRDIVKALTAPYVSTKGSSKPAEKRARELAMQILQAADKSREHIEKNFENVGDKFAEEARRIHYGETDERNIYGEATRDEAKDLTEEGINVFQLPPKRRLND